MPTVAPYGSWASPITPELLVEQAVGLSQLEVDGETVLWNELRPNEDGAQRLVSLAPGGEPTELLPPPWSARTLVHEYGGRCFAARAGAVAFSNFADQRLWRVDPGGSPVALTPEPPAPRSLRYADPEITPDGRWVVCVRERHAADGEVVNEVVAVAFDPAVGEVPVALAGGHDFFSAPRPSPDGLRLAWVSWDHPNMPWDSTRLWVADLVADGAELALGPATLVAGGEGESVIQPRWSPDGGLYYVSDRSGWWNLYRADGTALAPMDAEFAEADWVFGQSTYVLLADGRIVASWFDGTKQRLGLIADGQARPVDLPFTGYAWLKAAGSGVVAVAGSPAEAAAVVRIELPGGDTTVLRRSRELALDPSTLSVPEHLEFPTEQGRNAHLVYYPPQNGDFVGPDGELPPLVVVSHGGPTGRTSDELFVGLQFWTSRGFAIADIDYGGSTGYGRAYRERLRGTWGLVDVDDCCNAASWLAAQGRVDGTRMVIRGGSAGGFTTLAALTFRDVFAGGASHFGVADLGLLAEHTHKFESRYLDRLVGRYPEERAEYERRSPIHHAGQIARPLILFQGLDDAVVPPEQAELMFEALKAAGVPVAYLAFEGEQHGYRKAETIVRVAGAELAFYGRVLGFTPADHIEPFPIENETALRR